MIMGNMLKILRGSGKKDKYMPLDLGSVGPTDAKKIIHFTRGLTRTTRDARKTIWTQEQVTETVP